MRSSCSVPLSRFWSSILALQGRMAGEAKMDPNSNGACPESCSYCQRWNLRTKVGRFDTLTGLLSKWRIKGTPQSLPSFVPSFFNPNSQCQQGEKRGARAPTRQRLRQDHWFSQRGNTQNTKVSPALASRARERKYLPYGQTMLRCM